MKENVLPVGTKVFDIRFGWGEVIDKVDYNPIFPLYVKFEKEAHYTTYTKDGKIAVSNLNPILSLTEYTLENGGFTPLSDYSKPKLGDIGYFWDDNDVEIAGRVVYSKIIKINKYFFDSEMTRWENFSEEIPEWLTQKLGNNN